MTIPLLAGPGGAAAVMHGAANSVRQSAESADAIRAMHDSLCACPCPQCAPPETSALPILVGVFFILVLMFALAALFSWGRE